MGLCIYYKREKDSFIFEKGVLLEYPCEVMEFPLLSNIFKSPKK